jgi:hypothetical protein
MKSSKTHKLLRFVSLFLCFALSPVFLPAKDVDLKTAQKVAINAFSEYSGLSKGSVTISETIPVEKDGEIVFRVFNLNRNGFIIISAEDNALPILGYGTDANFSFDDAPPGLLFLLDGYKKEIKAIKEKKLKADENISKKWAQYSSDDYLSLKSYTIGSHLLGTTWQQDSPYYNSCPYDPYTGLRCKVGCGPVALGQILNYWKCRVFPDGTNTYTPPGFSNSLMVHFYDQDYHWDNMGVSDVANLLYNCGVAMNANYSSSQTSNDQGPVITALETFFGFTTDGIKWKTNYSPVSSWTNLIKAEIDAGRPVYYVGQDSLTLKGHAWVVEGYNSNNAFYCNWGWGQGYDGFYHLSYLNPSNTSYHFSVDSQGAIIGIKPILDACSGLSGSDVVCSSNTSYSVAIPSTASVVWSKTGNLTQVGGNTGSTYTVYATSTNGAAGSITATIKNSQGLTFLTRTKNVWAGTQQPGTISIQMDAPIHRFTATIQSLSTATTYNWYLNGVLNNTHHGTEAIFNRVSPYCGGSYNVDVKSYNPCGWSTLRHLTVIEPSCLLKLVITPNPTESESTIAIYNESGTIMDLAEEWELEVYDQQQGLKEKKTKLRGNQTKIDTANWNNGVYIVRAIVGEEVISEKLVVKH